MFRVAAAEVLSASISLGQPAPILPCVNDDCHLFRISRMHEAETESVAHQLSDSHDADELKFSCAQVFGLKRKKWSHRSRSSLSSI